MVDNVEVALDALARIGRHDEGVSREVEAVERALNAMREMLYGQR